MILTMFALASISVALLASCERQSGYEVRFAAVRAARSLEEPVNISLWLYPIGSKDKMTHYFDERKIEGPLWVFLPDSEFVPIPEGMVTDSGDFVFRIELNPNRFLTPPDAIFEASVALEQLLAPDEPQPAAVNIRARDGEPFVVRLEFRKTD